MVVVTDFAAWITTYSKGIVALALDAVGVASDASARAECVTSKWALYNKACKSAPENPAVSLAIFGKLTSGPIFNFLATAFRIYGIRFGQSTLSER